MSGDKIIPIGISPKQGNSERCLVRTDVWPSSPKCTHTYVTYYVTEGEGLAECGGCGEKLDPMFVLIQLANRESNMVRSVEEYKRWLKAYESKKRTKCRHCKRMTPVNVNLRRHR